MTKRIKKAQSSETVLDERNGVVLIERKVFVVGRMYAKGLVEIAQTTDAIQAHRLFGMKAGGWMAA